MATRKQIEANRRNAQKSTGPKTEEGKKIVSRNAVTHAMLANNVVVLPGEEEDYELFSLLISELSPLTPYENMLAVKATNAAWRSFRVNQIETGILTDAIRKEQEKERAAAANAEGSDERETDDPIIEDALRAGRAFVRSSPVLSTLARYRVKLDREFYKAIQELRMVQYARRHRYDPHYVANLKKFYPEPTEWKKARERD